MADREFMTMYEPAEREFYILLSLFADDAGWLDWDAGELAGSIFRYEPLEQRESKVSAFREHFESTGRLKVFRCGHAVMPRVAKRPRGMAREYAVQDAHKEHSKSTKEHSSPIRTLPNLSVPSEPVGSPRAPVRGGAAKSIGELMPDLKPSIINGAKKHSADG